MLTVGSMLTKQTTKTAMETVTDEKQSIQDARGLFQIAIRWITK